MSFGNLAPYPETPLSEAVQRVINAGGKHPSLFNEYHTVTFIIVYVTTAMGRYGGFGLQTGINPGNTPEAMAVAALDSLYTPKLFIIAPDGTKVFYQPGTASGGWTSSVKLTIVLNSEFIFYSLHLNTFHSYEDPDTMIRNDCTGTSSSFTGVVVLFPGVDLQGCDFAARCNAAARSGAVGCLFYGDGQPSEGSISYVSPSFREHMLFLDQSTIPSGIISSADGSSIIAVHCKKNP